MNINKGLLNSEVDYMTNNGLQSVLAILGLPGGSEWIIILIIAVLLFGKRLPEIARGLGKTLTEFKKGVKESEEEINKAIDESDKIAENHTNAQKETKETD